MFPQRKSSNRYGYSGYIPCGTAIMLPPALPVVNARGGIMLSAIWCASGPCKLVFVLKRKLPIFCCLRVPMTSAAAVAALRTFSSLPWPGPLLHWISLSQRTRGKRLWLWLVKHPERRRQPMPSTRLHTCKQATFASSMAFAFSLWWWSRQETGTMAPCTPWSISRMQQLPVQGQTLQMVATFRNSVWWRGPTGLVQLSDDVQSWQLPRQLLRHRITICIFFSFLVLPCAPWAPSISPLPCYPAAHHCMWFFRALYNLGFSLQVRACWRFVQQFLF